MVKVVRFRGFALAEVLVALVLSSVVSVALLAGLVALVRGMQPQRVAIGGEVLPIAPTFGSFPAAVRLHQAFTDRVATARAVYVFGGRHLSIPANSPAAALHPLKLQGLPASNAFAVDLPMDARSFYDRYADILGPEEPAADPDDFSVVVIGASDDALAVSAVVQVRRSTVRLADGAAGAPYVVRDVKLWDRDRDAQRYAFVERPALGVFVGAVHTWLRFGPDAVAEEGPACVVFPDPWIYAGTRGREQDVPAFSRFSYFLAVSR